MFKSIINAIKSLFSGLFKPSPDKPKPKPDPKETDAIEKLPQDGSEIQPDTIVIVANETEPVIIDPDEIDEEFDPDLFPDEEEEVVPIPEPEPPAPEPEEEPEPTGPVHAARYLWCLDNGHGIQTKGKRSPVYEENGEDVQFFEYEFNRDIVNRIAVALREKGVQFFITVPEVDVDDFLQERVARANAKKSDLPKIFVSVHANAAPARSSKDWGADSVRGIETWHYHNSKRGQKIASIFQKHLIDFTGFKNRHLKSRPKSQFYVLRKTKMTSILTENGFYNNRFEVKKLMSDKVRQQIADAHVAAILEIEEEDIA